MKIQRTISPAAAPLNLSAAVSGLLGLLFQKKYIRARESELKAHFGVKHVYLVSNGKAALFLILKALNALAPARNQVIIPAYTCYSVPSAIVKAGLQVVPCDMDLSTFDFDHRHLNSMISEKTLCVIANHLFGMPADMGRIQDICRSYGVPCVEDAAQAMGGNYRGQFLGTLGDVGFFSLGRGKNVTTGSGGIILTNSDLIAGALQAEYARLDSPGLLHSVKEYLLVLLMNVFIRPALYWFPAGIRFLKLGETIFSTNFPVLRFSGMHAGLLKNWKERLERSNRIRRRNVRYFSAALNLKLRNGPSSACLRLPLIAENKIIRDRLFQSARAKGLGVSTMYPAPVNEISELGDAFGSKTFPCARTIADRILTIPVHQLLTKRDRKKIQLFFQTADSSGTYQSWGDAPVVWDLQMIN